MHIINGSSLLIAGMISHTQKIRTLKSLACRCTNAKVTLTICQNTINTYRTIILLLGVACSFDIAYTVHPKFDPSTHMRLVLVPGDAQVGSIIYRLRAIDEEFDYPLTFELVGDTSPTVMIETLPCSKYNSVCQANVVLQRRLEIGRYYDFEISVKDTEGGVVTQLCSITATNFTTPHDLIFPHKPGIIIVPEEMHLVMEEDEGEVEYLEEFDASSEVQSQGESEEQPTTSSAATPEIRPTTPAIRPTTPAIRPRTPTTTQRTPAQTPRRSSRSKSNDEEAERQNRFLAIAEKQADTMRMLAENQIKLAENQEKQTEATFAMAKAIERMGKGLEVCAEAFKELSGAILNKDVPNN